jgi:hypothetical protein
MGDGYPGRAAKKKDFTAEGQRRQRGRDLTQSGKVAKWQRCKGAKKKLL